MTGRRGVATADLCGLGEGYCDHAAGLVGKVSLHILGMDVQPNGTPKQKTQGMFLGPPTLLAHATCMYLAYQGHA